MKNWKKMLCLALSALMILSCFSACGGQGGQKETEPSESVATEPAEEAKVLKVLTLGHSLAVDAGHMLAFVANAEGYEEMKVATLYYSGCPLNKHVDFLTNNSKEYALYVSSTNEPNAAPSVMEGVTMGDAIRYDYWDIIVMQGGVFEIGRSETYTNGDIQTIQKYVNENKKNPLAIFAWNMAWAPPVDNDLRATYTVGNENPYITTYKEFKDDRSVLYNAITKCVNDHIVTDDTFKFVIPSGTVFENALSSYLEEKDMHRDYAHASDLGRLMVSYVWYCSLVGIEKLDEIKVNTVPKALFRSRQEPIDWTLTQAEKDLILETVNNALANRLQMTQSQYTVAP